MKDDLKKAVQERYRKAALGAGSCCGGDSASACCDPVSSKLYSDQQAGELPREAVQASLGCGNPTALAPLIALPAAGWLLLRTLREPETADASTRR